ncbi:MAG TPA: response regulator transcription factor [Micromonospora sp.]
MVRTLLALEGGLVRGALAYVLGTEDDIDVVGEVDAADDVEAALAERRPDVIVIDLDLVTVDHLPKIRTASERLGGCRLLVLVEPRRAALLGEAMTAHSPHVGFLSKNVSPQRVVESIRKLAAGKLVIDGDLVIAALRPGSPLTRRELEVLDVAAQGCPVKEIASKLALSPGTVRNHLSRILTKTGARTRLEAVRIAQQSGWL